MDIKDVLLLIRPAAACSRATAVAARIGRQQGALVTGLCIAPMPEMTMADGYALGANAISEVVTRFDKAVEAAVAAADQPFEAAMRAAGAEFAWGHTDPGDSLETVALTARLADLVVLPRPQTKDPESRDLAQAMVLIGGAPCLLVPEDGRETVAFDRVALAWNGSRQARRAMDGAMPFLRLAKRVDILAFGPKASRETQCRDLAAHLRRKGVVGEVTHLAIHSPDCAQALLAWCREAEADLLVMGAFGHSPTREHWFGGTTWTVMTTASLPVLMAN